MISDTTIPRQQYTLSTGTDALSFDFYTLSASHLTVWNVPADGSDPALLVLDTDYSVSGTEDEEGNVTVTMIGQAAGDVITILRVPTMDQLLSLVFKGKIYEESLESGLDKLTMICLALQEQMNRAVQYPPTETTGWIAELDAAADRIGKLIRFDENGALAFSAELGDWQGEWVTATSYGQWDMFRVASTASVYHAVTAHTSTNIAADLAAGRIAYIIDGTVIADSAAAAAASAAESAASAAAALVSEGNASTSAAESAASAVESSDSEDAAAASEIAAAASAASISSLYNSKANKDGSNLENGVIDTIHLTASLLAMLQNINPALYKGEWNPVSDSPTLPVASSAGDWWYISTAGTASGTNADDTYQEGDFVIDNGTTWDKRPRTPFELIDGSVSYSKFAEQVQPALSSDYLNYTADVVFINWDTRGIIGSIETLDDLVYTDASSSDYINYGDLILVNLSDGKIVYQSPVYRSTEIPISEIDLSSTLEARINKPISEITIGMWGTSITADGGMASGLATLSGLTVNQNGYAGKCASYIIDQFEAEAVHDDVLIFELGRNDIQSGSVGTGAQYLDTVELCFNALKRAVADFPAGTRWLVMSLGNCRIPNEVEGGSAYLRIEEYNQKLQRLFPDNFFDYRGHLIDGHDWNKWTVTADYVQPASIGGTVQVEVNDTTDLTATADSFGFGHSYTKNKVSIGTLASADHYTVISVDDATHVTLQLDEVNNTALGATATPLVFGGATNLFRLYLRQEHLDYSDGISPSTLRRDQIHLSNDGEGLISVELYKTLKSKQWI